MTIASVIEELDKLPGEPKEDPIRQRHRNILERGMLPRCRCKRFIQLDRLAENPLERKCAVCGGTSPAILYGYQGDISVAVMKGQARMSARMFFSNMKL